MLLIAFLENLLLTIHYLFFSLSLSPSPSLFPSCWLNLSVYLLGKDNGGEDNSPYILLFLFWFWDYIQWCSGLIPGSIPRGHAWDDVWDHMPVSQTRFAVFLFPPKFWRILLFLIFLTHLITHFSSCQIQP